MKILECFFLYYKILIYIVISIGILIERLVYISIYCSGWNYDSIDIYIDINLYDKVYIVCYS